MRLFTVTDPMVLTRSASIHSACYDYACAEMARLLGRLGVAVETVCTHELAGPCLCLHRPGTDLPDARPVEQGLAGDAYSISVAEDSIALSAVSPKGVLNSVYDLAEQFGFSFLLPGLDGEWIPEKPRALPVGCTVKVPRFPFRGVFWQSLDDHDYTTEEWLMFYAKLRFNAVTHAPEDRVLCEKTGLRLEIGGHGLSGLLPRELFGEHPEYFRMFQPEDFGGKRMNDANLCVSNQAGREIVKTNFAKKLVQVDGVHAIHAWADDLPAGGWCLCPSCRAFSPTDQAMLAMRVLAETAREQGSSLRIPLIAYHDTMMPGAQVPPPEEGFLLFAPRERCYGHALDDASCERNRFYLAALKAWQEKCKDLDDAHTFEYYFDQILFRGMYPFLPYIILDDIKVYERHGIQCHMSLQVAGPAFAPEYNMLIFAKAMWDRDLTAESCMSDMAKAICPAAPEPWQAFLESRAEIFTKALRMCEHDPQIYLDYRWLPETTGEFGQIMAAEYEAQSSALTEAAEAFEQAIGPAWPDRTRAAAKRELLRARFEAAELHAMSCQQHAVNELARFLVTRAPDAQRRACDHLRQAIQALELSHDRARETGMPEDTTWYFNNVNSWLRKELSAKLANVNGNETISNMQRQ